MIPGENLCAYVFYVFCSRIVYFICLRIRMQVKSCKKDLVGEFKMKDLGLMHYSLVWKYGKEMGRVWHLDSGASFHMMGNKEFFTN